jgi:hypothetical protein
MIHMCWMDGQKSYRQKMQWVTTLSFLWGLAKNKECSTGIVVCISKYSVPTHEIALMLIHIPILFPYEDQDQIRKAALVRASLVVPVWFSSTTYYMLLYSLRTLPLFLVYHSNTKWLIIVMHEIITISYFLSHVPLPSVPVLNFSVWITLSVCSF